MNGNKAKLKYSPNNFEIIEDGFILLHNKVSCTFG